MGLFLPFFKNGVSSSRGGFERRLLSLIFADRNRIILIRRELPPARVASPAERSRILLCACSGCGWRCSRIGNCCSFVGFLFFHWLESFCFCLCCCPSSGRHTQLAVGLRFDPDGPDKAQQFAPHGGYDLALVLASRRQPGMAFCEPDLRLPGDLLDGFRHSFLPLALPGADGWSQPIAPGRFNNDTSEMSVA